MIELTVRDDREKPEEPKMLLLALDAGGAGRRGMRALSGTGVLTFSCDVLPENM